MKYNPMTRRMFLQGSGGALLAIPFLSSLLPKEAWGQSAGGIKRFVSIISNYDYGHHASWLPMAAGTPINNIGQPNRTLTPPNGHHAIRYQPLREFAPTNASNLSILAGNAFSPYLESMNILRSLNHTIRYGHGAGQVLGGIIANRGLHESRGNLQTIETVDTVLNKNRNFNPAGLPQILAASPGYGPDNYSYTSVGGAPAANTTAIGQELSNIYNRLFSNGSFPQNGGTSITHPKNNILTRVLEDFTRVRNSRNISSVDRLALQNAADQFSDVQRSLTRVATAQCSHSALSRSGFSYQMADNVAIGRAMADLISASIMCDSARVFTLGTELLGGVIDGQSSDHQEVSHVPFQIFGGKPSWQITAERQAAISRNFVAPLIQRLSAAIDPGNSRSYLYNSLVYYTADAGLVHGFGSHPVTLFGNAGGAITSGNYIDYANRAKGAFGGGDTHSPTPGDPQFSNNWYGVSYNRLMVTILQAMGVTPQEYENNALNTQIYNRIDIGTENRNLNNIGGFGYACPADISAEDPNGFGFRTYILPGLAGHDFRQFRYPLAFPT